MQLGAFFLLLPSRVSAKSIEGWTCLYFKLFLTPRANAHTHTHTHMPRAIYPRCCPPMSNNSRCLAKTHTSFKNKIYPTAVNNFICSRYLGYKCQRGRPTTNSEACLARSPAPVNLKGDMFLALMIAQRCLFFFLKKNVQHVCIKA